MSRKLKADDWCTEWVILVFHNPVSAVTVPDSSARDYT